MPLHHFENFFSFFMLRLLVPVLLVNSLIFFANCFCSSFLISILIMPFLIASSRFRIASKLAKSYVVLYPLCNIFAQSVFFCSQIFSRSFAISALTTFSVIFFIDSDSLSGDSKGSITRICFSSCFSTVFVCSSNSLPIGE